MDFEKQESEYQIPDVVVAKKGLALASSVKPRCDAKIKNQFFLFEYDS